MRKLRSDITREGLARTPHRAFMRAMGLDDAAIQKPMIGVVSMKGEQTPCNMTHGFQVEAAKEGVAEAGGTPREFTTISVSDGISMNHEGMKFSLVSRELIADSIEAVVHGLAYERGSASTHRPTSPHGGAPPCVSQMAFRRSGTESWLTLRWREMIRTFGGGSSRLQRSHSAIWPVVFGNKTGDNTPSLKRGREMARPASNLHLQPKNGGWRARVLVPVELQAKLGKKLFHTPVWRVTKSEAAALAWPEVQKFEALIENARSGKCSSAIEVEAQAPLRPLVPSFQLRGTRNDASETTFTALIAEWARKKRIDNPQTKQQRETHFKSLADFLGHDDGAKVTSQNIVAFEKHLATTPDPRTGKLRHPNTVLGYLSSFRGVFKIAVQQILIDTNPMDNVVLGSKIESKRRPYSVEQVSLILTRAQAETDDIFLPILVQAYSGCRVAEIVDCSTLDFNFVRNGDPEKVIPGQWFLFIGEDNREPGCTIKGHTARYAPLHPEIVKRLIPYMERVRTEHGDGALFRHLPKDKNGKWSTYVARKIDEWMDGVIKDPNHGGYSIEFGNAEHLAPNHSFRHYLKSELLARDVPERISDSITGHKTPGIGRKYEHVPMSKKFEAIRKLPVIPLQAA